MSIMCNMMVFDTLVYNTIGLTLTAFCGERETEDE